MTTSEKYIKTPEMAQPVMEDKIENSTECFKCKQATFYPVKCARCVEWRKRHSAPFLMPFRDVFKKTKATTTEPLCVNCISQDDYYGNICAECQDYLSAIAWNEPPPSPFPTECANCKNPTIYPAEREVCRWPRRPWTPLRSLQLPRWLLRRRLRRLSRLSVRQPITQLTTKKTYFLFSK